MGLLGRAPTTYVNVELWIERKVEALLKFEVSLAIIDSLFVEDGGASRDEQVIRSRARQWIGGLAQRCGRPVELARAEPFIVQRCAPGHFVNMDELYGQMLGEPPAPPSVIE